MEEWKLRDDAGTQAIPLRRKVLNAYSQTYSSHQRQGFIPDSRCFFPSRDDVSQHSSLLLGCGKHLDSADHPSHSEFPMFMGSAGNVWSGCQPLAKHFTSHSRAVHPRHRGRSSRHFVYASAREQSFVCETVALHHKRTISCLYDTYSHNTLHSFQRQTRRDVSLIELDRVE